MPTKKKKKKVFGVAKLLPRVGWLNHPQVLFRGDSTTPKTHCNTPRLI